MLPWSKKQSSGQWRNCTTTWWNATSCWSQTMHCFGGCPLPFGRLLRHVLGSPTLSSGLAGGPGTCLTLSERPGRSSNHPSGQWLRVLFPPPKKKMQAQIKSCPLQRNTCRWPRLSNITSSTALSSPGNSILETAHACSSPVLTASSWLFSKVSWWKSRPSQLPSAAAW